MAALCGIVACPFFGASPLSFSVDSATLRSAQRAQPLASARSLATAPCFHRTRSAVREGAIARPAGPVKKGSKMKELLGGSLRNVVLVGTVGGVIAGSYFLTGKWWKLPLLFAVPSMLYRLYVSHGDTGKLAEISASVDPQFVADTKEAQKELRQFTCSECGYTIFPARGRVSAFFNDKFKCPSCDAPASAFVDMTEDDEEESESQTTATTAEG